MSVIAIFRQLTATLPKNAGVWKAELLSLLNKNVEFTGCHEYEIKQAISVEIGRHNSVLSIKVRFPR
jgi:hypothetical protein